ncbi:dihydroxyacetone kinase subunit DhaK [Clostridium tetani]|nr:dihydroxyacetone kinase subunit DhaK [Clostridium tetani]BDR70163.1 dihydroxyacetone kinase subunit DhaK [Clostridium tetani]BDR78706.1 dihydroxyacetone kinase subunit DhaK [Clostridium tetani]BEV19800.1 dihydroxyacetone kinase subunit DhaK [Clostridium tetani]SUY56393.1 dihydroxyacetone kinase subunit DhaK [Clostridium tetani]
MLYNKVKGLEDILKKGVCLSMKKIINNVDYAVEDMLEGMIKAYPNKIRKLDAGNIIVRKDAPIKDKVALVSGGGSGHEPAHGGYVGKGMLDAAVAGAVFTSPTPDQVFEAVKAVDGGRGVLLVIKNYSGDVMNFEMAKDMAEMEGIQVEAVVVNDDVAVEDSTYTTGRRGIAGTIFIHKIAGAKAEKGASLEEVKSVAEKVISNVKSMGVALTPCTVPAAAKPSFTLEENEMEIGIGIHGEPGTHREELKSADEITEHLVNKILDDIKIDKGEEVAIMVNGLGSTPLMELFIVNKKVHQMLEDKGIKVYETFVGEYMTSLEMAGCSVTLLKLDEELKELLDANADTPAMKVL